MWHKNFGTVIYDYVDELIYSPSFVCIEQFVM